MESAPAGAASGVRTIDRPNDYTCGQSGLIDFENLPDQTDLSPTAINGVHFTTTGGFTWRVADMATGRYNSDYTGRGTHVAWLGRDQGSGRIDFVAGRAGYVSMLVSNETDISLDAYSAGGTKLESAGPATNNVGTGKMTELVIDRRAERDIAHVVVHDTGNFFVVDAICTDAEDVGSPGRYVALGDSFSAGEGVPEFWPHTDTASPGGPSGNYCHRSEKGAYPSLIAGQLGIPQAVEHWACSAAIIRDFYEKFIKEDHEPGTSRVVRTHEGETRQLDRLSDDVSLVTLTIGGNDIGFETLITKCLAVTQNKNKEFVKSCEDSLLAPTLEKIKALKNSLPELYGDIRERAPKARVYVVGYPRLLPRPTEKCRQSVRYEDQSPLKIFGIGWFEFHKESVTWLNTMTDALNATIKSAAEASGFTFVDVSEVLRDSTGWHTACNGEPWAHGLLIVKDVLVNNKPVVSRQSFHPNATGQMKIAAAVAAKIRESGFDYYLRQGEKQPSFIDVLPGRSNLNAWANWDGSDFRLTLTSSGGRVIDRETTAPDVTHHHGPTNESFSVADPEPGRWEVEILAADVPAVGEAVRLETSQAEPLGPSPLMRVSPSRGVAPLGVELDATGSLPSEGEITSYEWAFDDGSEPTTGVKQRHVFTSAGDHVVTLTVTDSEGRSTSASQIVHVTQTNVPPTAAIAQSADGGPAPLEVFFDASDSDDEDGVVERFEFDFGDGSPPLVTNEPVASHIYQTGGTHTPRVRVVDDLGETASAAGSPILIEGGNTPEPTPGEFLFTVANRATLGKTLKVEDEDVARFEAGTQSFELVFDGSDVGIKHLAIDALASLPDGHLVMSFTKSGKVPGVGKVEAADLVRFHPTSLGAVTDGTFSLFFDGSDIGLTKGGENVDAVDVVGNDLYLSTSKSFDAAGVKGGSSDILVCRAATFGARSACGTSEVTFRGWQADLTKSGENIDGFSFGPDGPVGLPYFSATGDFAAGGLQGRDQDVFACAAALAACQTTAAAPVKFNLVFEGRRHGIGSNDIAAIDFSGRLRPNSPIGEQTRTPGRDRKNNAALTPSG
jgi:PKD repeat protein/lysophospholipase L1-like esterase